MGSGTNMGPGKNMGKKKLKLKKFNASALDLFFSSKLDLEGKPFHLAADIDKVLECHDERTNEKSATIALNTLVIKETKIEEKNKVSFIGDKKESASKVIKKDKKVTTLSRNTAHHKAEKVTTSPKDNSRLRSKVFRRDVMMAEAHRNSQNKTIIGLNTETQRANSKGHKKNRGSKKHASAEMVHTRQSSEGPTRKATRMRRTKSAENPPLKENIEPKDVGKGNKSIKVRRTKSDPHIDKAASRKRSWSMKQSDEEQSHIETNNSSQKDQMNKTQELELDTSHVTAKRGTLKYFKQRQNVLETLANESKTEDDFFSNPEAPISQNMAIYDDSDDSLTVKTPVGKSKRRNIPPNITPRTALIGQHCAITPTAGKKESPKPFAKDKNCVLHEIYHLQELKKKNGKRKKAGPEEQQLETKLDVTPLEFPRFEDKQVDEENVDDYFDDSI